MIAQRQLFLQLLGQTSPTPLMLEVERAQGIYMYTPEGKDVIDLISGVSVSNLGHCHPRVVAAVQQQVATYMHLMVYGEVVQSPQVQFAQLLTSILPDNLQSVYLVNSGSEAIEVALKLAKRVSGRRKMVSCYNAYHGSTHGALSVMGGTEFKRNYEPLLPEVSHIHFNSLADIEVIQSDTACVLVEVMQGEAGIVPATQEFLTALRQKCNKTGTLLIFDEVQTAFGRTGKMFAFEHYGVVPDIICFAKGLGGGMPMGAVVSSKRNMDCFTHNPVLGHITTFGGHPVSAAAGLASLRELVENKSLIGDIEHKSQLFISLLKHHKAIKSIQGRGLFLSVELASRDTVFALIPKALEHGILTDSFLFCETHIRIAPPFIITESEIHEACRRLLCALDEV
ncbi:MAG: aspartate aminotransferase family protein [Bacteroidales bacterium]|jgi:acetylornithine/succinyldiaminopimelate/putrescine aminotransferase|nr:aspartate aminotransferase family protein [Bacteroidales bacterium]